MKIHDYCSYECLESVVDYIIQHNCMDADAVIVTGDISQDGSDSSYRFALMQLSRMNLPLYYISGNHDNKFIMDFVFSESSQVKCFYELDQKDWKFINVNTVQDGTDSGFISENRLLIIEQEIIQNKEMKIALFMHHHPVSVGIPLVDECMLINNREIMNLCDAHHQIKVIACGHAHTDYTKKYNNCIIDGCPATCFQWCDGAADIKTKNKRGFKVLNFNDKYRSETIFI